MTRPEDSKAAYSFRRHAGKWSGFCRFHVGRDRLVYKSQDQRFVELGCVSAFMAKATEGDLV